MTVGMNLPSLMILWLALPFIWLEYGQWETFATVKPEMGNSLRCEAYTASILLEARVIQTLLLGQSLTPAIALGGLVGCVLFLHLRCFNLLIIGFFRFQAHPRVDERQGYSWQSGRRRVDDSSL